MASPSSSFPPIYRKFSRYSDRILVARQGRIVEEMDISEATETKIMYAAVH
jgi:ABC-type sugar transport system ATPase subunit